MSCRKSLVLLRIDSSSAARRSFLVRPFHGENCPSSSLKNGHCRYDALEGHSAGRCGQVGLGRRCGCRYFTPITSSLSTVSHGPLYRYLHSIDTRYRYLLHATEATQKSSSFDRKRDDDSYKRELQAQRLRDAEVDDLSEEDPDEDFVSSGGEEENHQTFEAALDGADDFSADEATVKALQDTAFGYAEESDDAMVVDVKPQALVLSDSDSDVEILGYNSATAGGSGSNTQVQNASVGLSGLGAFTEDTEYDDTVLFSHLVIYLDTAANSVKNNFSEYLLSGVQLRRSEKACVLSLILVEQSLTLFNSQVRGRETACVCSLLMFFGLTAFAVIEEGGGRVTDNLMDPTLTHIVVSDILNAGNNQRHRVLIDRTSS